MSRRPLYPPVELRPASSCLVGDRSAPWSLAHGATDVAGGAGIRTFPLRRACRFSRYRFAVDGLGGVWRLSPRAGPLQGF